MRLFKVLLVAFLVSFAAAPASNNQVLAADAFNDALKRALKKPQQAAPSSRQPQTAPQRNQTRPRTKTRTKSNQTAKLMEQARQRAALALESASSTPDARSALSALKADPIWARLDAEEKLRLLTYRMGKLSSQD